MLSEIIFLLVFAVMFVILGYWSVSKVLSEELDVSKITKIKIGIIVPFSLLFPLTMFKLIDAYAFFIYLITVPISVLLIKKLSLNENLTLSSSFIVYKAIAGKILVVIVILGAIAKVIKLFIHN